MEATGYEKDILDKEKWISSEEQSASGKEVLTYWSQQRVSFFDSFYKIEQNRLIIIEGRIVFWIFCFVLFCFVNKQRDEREVVGLSRR